MTNQTLANTVVDILYQPGIRKINFQFGGLIVTGDRFAAVARAVTRGDIECKVVDKFIEIPGHKLSEGKKTAAQYNVERNEMLFSREKYGTTSGYEKSNMLHEAVHAMFDLFAKPKGDSFLGIDDESAAVLAEAFYIRFCDVSNTVFAMDINGYGEWALKVADHVIEQTERYNYPVPYFISLGIPEVVRFRQAVANKWEFIKKGDTDMSGARSIYDGVPCRACRQSIDAVINRSGGQEAGAAMRSGTKVY